MPKIIVLDNIAAEGLALLDAAPNIEYVVKTGLKGTELATALQEADGAICRSGVKITPESLENNRRLKAIVRAGVGTDNIDKPAATRQGIVVMNTPTGNTLSTAEHAFALMLGLSRNLAPANQSLVEGRWDRKAYMGSQLAAKTLGIVGLGRIGQEVAKRAAAFEMTVLGYDPFLSPEQANKLGIELVESVRDMLPRVDYLTVHTPLTNETRGLIGKDELSLLKPGVRLINCARGGIYDESALVEGIQQGVIGGVALDVFEDEPCSEHELFGNRNSLCTPHLGASTEEAQTQVALEAVQLLVDFLSTGAIRHAVNMAAVDPSTLQEIQGELDVAYRLGLLLAQWHGGGASACELEYRGDVANKDTRLLTAAFCSGLLQNALDEEVNMVNAEVLLEERGIRLSQTATSEHGAFSSSIRATLKKDDFEYVAAGTLFGNNMPRLIRLGDYRLESYLDGNLFVFLHNDVPGIIGSVGTIFGRHNVNIAHMAVGRAEPGGEAIGVLNLDQVPPAEAVAEVQADPNITKVKVISLPPAKL